MSVNAKRQPEIPFSKGLLFEITSRLELCVQLKKTPPVAVFDADGTLWDIDVGELFFRYEIDHKLIRSISEESWQKYFDIKKKNPPEAYLWLAQIHAGVPLHDVQKWGDRCRDEIKEFPYFESQKNLIRWMLDRGIQVFIVSASVKWAVEPFALKLGIPRENILGVKTHVRNGVVTAEQDGPITWRAGKPEGLLERTGNIRPVFACGNTTGDFELIELSEVIRLAVGSQNTLGELRASEQELRSLAHSKGWSVHEF